MAPNEKILKYNNMKKWDVILANPPFDLGEKMLAKWFDLSDTICTVQPSTWLLGKKKTKSICSHLDSGEFNVDIESINGSEFFDAKIGGEMAIQFFTKNLGMKNIILFNNKQYKYTNEIKRFSNDLLLVSFYNIVHPLFTIDNLDEHVYARETSTVSRWKKPDVSDENYVFRIGRFCGDKNKKTGKLNDQFYTIVYKDMIDKSIGTFGKLKYETQMHNGKKNMFMNNYFNLITKQNALNFSKYIQTDFVRGCLLLIKNTISIDVGELKYIPWFDFSDPVFSKSPSEIDDYLFAKYIPEVDEETGITRDEIRKHIEELLPDYYNIRK